MIIGFAKNNTIYRQQQIKKIKQEEKTGLKAI